MNARNMSIVLAGTVAMHAAAGTTDVFAQCRALGRGFNMGNALEAPAGQNWGVTLEPAYFARIREAGFSSVRIPIRWPDHTTTNAPFTIAPSFFGTVDTVAGWALSNGLVAIINMHHFDALTEHPAAQRGKFLALWRQIAAHYRTYPDSLYFELLNEPCRNLTNAAWNPLLKDALREVRATNPRRAVIVGPVNWNTVRELPGLDLPDGDRNLIATFHYYNPFAFTHQGAEWAEGMRDRTNVAWTGSAAERKAVADDFAFAAAWARTHGRPLYLGEFGAYSKADMASRARWTACVAREAEQHGMSWAYWEFCAGFGAFDPRKGAWRKDLLDALMPERDRR